MNNIYHKITYILIAVISCCSTINSQEINKQELSVSLSGGLSALNSKTNIGTDKNKFGGAVGFGYTYFLTENLGIVSGLEMSLYKSEFKVDQFNNTLMNVADPSDGELIDFYSSVSNYKENQTATYLNIPVQIQYQQNAFGSNKFYVLGGVKIGIPIKGKYETKNNSFVNKGYFHETGIWGGEGQEFMGFGTYTDKKSKDDLSMKVSFTLSAEAGMKWAITSNMSLYTGLYLDYGLNNVVSDKGNFISLEETDTGMDFVSNSVLATSYNEDRKDNKFVDKVSLFAGGIKIRLAFGQ